jgi:low affinity Fe/Cu permease
VVPGVLDAHFQHEVAMNGSAASRLFSKFASTISELSGRPTTFALAVTLVAVWAVSGPFFNFSETWQLVINTSTTIVTFLMVFVLQNSQNRDGKALQAKIDELILTSQAQNKFVGIEKLDEEEIREVSETLAEKAEALEDVADKAEVLGEATGDTRESR